MSKVLLIVVVVVLAVACGALGWQAVEKKGEERLASAAEGETTELERRIEELEAGSHKGATARDMQLLVRQSGELSKRLDRIEKQLAGLAKENTDLKKELAEVKEEPGGGIFSGKGLFDLSRLSEEDRKVVGEIVKGAMLNQKKVLLEGVRKGVTSRFQQEVGKLYSKLELQPEQKEQIDRMLAERVREGFQVLDEFLETGDTVTARAKFEEIVEKGDESIKEILDPDQIEKLKELDPSGFARRELRREGGSDETER